MSTPLVEAASLPSLPLTVSKTKNKIMHDQLDDLYPNPIDKYTEMLISCSDAGSVNAISSKALSDPTVYYGFAELLALTTVNEFASKALLNTLELFAYGTVLEYYSYSPATQATRKIESEISRGFYIDLTNVQLNKLKALTILNSINQHTDVGHVSTNVGADVGAIVNVTNCESKSQHSRRSRRRQIQNDQMHVPTSDSTNIVSYATLQAHLGINNSIMNSTEEIRNLEDLLMHCIYSNLLPAGTKLDQKRNAIHVKLTSNTLALDASHVLCRDVHLAHDLPIMIRTLETFYQQSKETKSKLFTSSSQIKVSRTDEIDYWKQIDLNIQLTQSMIGNGNGIGNSNVKDDGNNMEDIVKAGSMEWAISASTDRQVKRSRAATATVTGIPNSANDTAIGGAGRKTGIFGFGKRG